MSIYTPNSWAIIKISEPGNVTYKVLAGWSGGFADADRWRFNSGITRFEEDGQTIRFYGYSKPVYACDTRCEGFISLTRSIYNQLLTQAEAEHLVLEHISFQQFKEEMENQQ